MAMAGETITLGADPTCGNCGEPLDFRVMQTGAGYYVGTICCQGPYSRETRYFASKDEAVLCLVDSEYGAKPTADYR